MTVIIGCDPGLTMTAFALIHDGRGRVKLAGHAFAVHDIKEIFRVATNTFNSPGWGNAALFAIEENIGAAHGNIKTALKQREVIGVCKLAAMMSGLTVVEVYPKSAKLALTGSGNADKDEMVAAAGRIVDGFPGGLTVAKSEALADACGIALAGLRKDVPGGKAKA